jgi:CheY-like chemotaxis protein
MTGSLGGEGSGEGKRRVLIVDDEAQTRTLLKTTLKGLSVPCEILEAVDGDTALKLAREERPDLVLLDIVLPGSSVSGVLVCQELVRDSRTRVVIVSGQAGEQVVRSCIALGAVAHVRKPFSVAEMRGNLERWLGG